MKHPRYKIKSIQPLLCKLVLLCFLITYPATKGYSTSPGIPKQDKKTVYLDEKRVLTDIRQAPWEYFAIPPEKTPASYGMYYIKKDSSDINEEYQVVLNKSKWRTIEVGKRWELMGHPELNDSKVWLKLKVFVPKEMQGRQIGFFCTAVDDIADVFLNGDFLGNFKYEWGARIHEPVNVEFSSSVKYGEENLLMIRINDLAKARSGGMLGNVVLYHTLPFTRTSEGGIDLGSNNGSDYTVSLHLGDALLSNGSQTSFTAGELRKMEIPPYILREDELILVTAGKPEGRNEQPLLVDLQQVSSTRCNKTLAVNISGSLPGQTGLFDLISIPLDLQATYSNPFSPKQINVQAILETPSGKMEEIAAFFQQDFTPIEIGEEEEILLPRKGNPWQLNYRPRETGKFKLQIIAQDCTGIAKSDVYAFEVIPSSRKGFLKVSKEDPRFLEFDNGESYFGIGPSGWLRNSHYIFGGNTRWISTRLLDEYYQRKADAGSNYDYFLAEFFGRLYTQGGYMDQHIAWKMDHRLRTLEKLGIYWMTCYDDLCRSTVYGLNTLPYSEAQGGPCKSIPELYFNTISLEMQREHLRYFVGRMSDSPAIMAWSIGDEWQMGMSFSLFMVRSWIKELHNYVKTIDVYNHPHIITEGPASMANGGDAIIIPDWYFKTNTDAVSFTLDIMKKYESFQCPLINPEGGMVEWTKPEDKYGPKHAGYYLMGERWKFPEAISFHNHLWISLFTKSAVGGTEWMGQFIDRKNQLFHATAIRNFLQGESLTKPKWEMKSPRISDTGLRGFALLSQQQSWVWVHNNEYTWINAGHYGNTPRTISNSTITIPVGFEGNCMVEYWDTRTGTITSTVNTTVKDGSVTCSLPPIANDVALKIKSQQP